MLLRILRILPEPMHPKRFELVSQISLLELKHFQQKIEVIFILFFSSCLFAQTIINEPLQNCRHTRNLQRCFV